MERYAAMIGVITENSDAQAKSSAAERMRRHRNRRRKGLRCFTVVLRETEIDGLARRGYLSVDQREDRNAVLAALYSLLDRTFEGDS
jgi:hypothetical protein